MSNRLSASKGWFPFWFWNDRLDPDEMRWQIAEMAAKGVRGFIISPRQGLAEAYLSERYFELVEVAIEAAAKHGLSVQIFDEFPYPSGAAGGEVLEGHPEFYATMLAQKSFDVSGGASAVRVDLPRGKMISCIAYPIGADGSIDWSTGRDLREFVGTVLGEESFSLTGMTTYDPTRYFASVPAPKLDAMLPDGKWRVFASVQQVWERFKYYGHFADTMQPACVKRFIELTHERYRKRVGKHFGKTITAFFTDETCPMWSQRVPEEVYRRCGYELAPLLPALAEPTHPRHVTVKADLDRVEYEMCVETFDEPVARWCRENGVAWWAEKHASRLAHVKHQDGPGCDAAHARVGKDLAKSLIKSGLRSSSRAMASAAYLYGKDVALCEAYHSMGWGANLQDIKWLADGLMLLGVECIVPHAFYYSSHALRKHDAAPSFFFQMPYWERFGCLTAHTDRVLEAMHGTWIDAKVILVDPSPGAPTEEQRQDWARAQIAMMEEHFDFLIADVDSLQAGQIESGTLKLRDLSIGVVIVTPMRQPEAALIAWLTKFETAGGIVLRVSEKFERDGFVRKLREIVRPGLSIDGLTRATRETWCVTRTDGSRCVHLLLNTASAPAELNLQTDRGLVERSTGAEHFADLSANAGGYTLRLRPYELVILEDSGAPDGSPARINVRFGGSMRVRPLSKNLLRLGNWRMTVVEAGSKTRAVPVRPSPIINQLTDNRVAFPAAADPSFGWPMQLTMPPLDVRYEAEFRNDYRGKVELVMEPGALAGDWSIRINGSRPLRESNFKLTQTFIRGCVGVDVTSRLRRGANRVVVELKASRHDHGLRSPLYLAGDFGVTARPLGLPTRQSAASSKPTMPTACRSTRASSNTRRRSSSRVPAADALVEFDFGPTPFTDAADISVNGGDWHTIPWSPRTALLPAGTLRRGQNDLVVRVYTSLMRAFDGTRLDHVTHQPIDVA